MRVRLHRVVFLGAMLMICAFSSRASSGASAYSILGIGDLRYLPSVRSAGMGSTGLGLPFDGSINSLSPATWSRFGLTRLEVGLVRDGFSSTDGTQSRNISDVRFTGALLGIPISQARGIGVVAGIVPYSGVDYDTYSSGTHAVPPDSFSYDLHQVGSGRLSRALLGASFMPMEQLFIGASINFLFGKNQKTTTQIPLDDTHAGGTIVDETNIQGLSLTFSILQESLGGVAEALRPLSLGATLSTKTRLRAETESRYQYTLETDTTSSGRRDIVVPLAWGVGAGWRAGERFVLAADFSAQAWSHATVEDQPWPNIRDSWRIGVGAERTASRSAEASWLDRVSYRLGFTFSPTYYSPGGKGIDEWFATAGASLPLGGENRLHLAVEYGRRGTTNNNLIQDSILRVSASVCIGEVWFMRPEED